MAKQEEVGRAVDHMGVVKESSDEQMDTGVGAAGEMVWFAGYEVRTCDVQIQEKTVPMLTNRLTKNPHRNHQVLGGPPGHMTIPRALMKMLCGVLVESMRSASHVCPSPLTAHPTPHHIRTMG